MKKILIVEDVEMNRDILFQLLEEDYELVAAEDGRQGLEMAAQEKPDLILLDVGLPEIDGFEVTRRIRAIGELRRRPSLPSPPMPWPATGNAPWKLAAPTTC